MNNVLSNYIFVVDLTEPLYFYSAYTTEIVCLRTVALLPSPDLVAREQVSPNAHQTHARPFSLDDGDCQSISCEREIYKVITHGHSTESLCQSSLPSLFSDQTV